MNNLFTVDYALNFLGWEYDKNVAPYNYYKLGTEYVIKTRRNDFYLIVWIYNSCNVLVFVDKIITIEDYRRKVIPNLIKWRCRQSSSVTPTPSTQPLVINPTVVSRTYEESNGVSETIANAYNDTCTLLTPCTIPGLTVSVLGGTDIILSGTATTVGTYFQILSFVGITSGEYQTIDLTVTVTPQINYIIQENNDYILTQDSGKLIQEI